jgi:hypothetical protein
LEEQPGELLMRQADRDRLVALKKAKDKKIAQGQAAEELGTPTIFIPSYGKSEATATAREIRLSATFQDPTGHLIQLARKGVSRCLIQKLAGFS